MEYILWLCFVYIVLLSISPSTHFALKNRSLVSYQRLLSSPHLSHFVKCLSFRLKLPSLCWQKTSAAWSQRLLFVDSFWSQAAYTYMYVCMYLCTYLFKLWIIKAKQNSKALEVEKTSMFLHLQHTYVCMYIRT